MARPSAAMALRDSFGDRKVPEISRKITACVACRKQKVKCYMNGSNPPCRRCTARGLPCTVNKSLQMLLETDADWKEGMEQRMRRLEAAVRMDTTPQDNPSSSPSSSSTEPRISPPEMVGTTVEASNSQSFSAMQQADNACDLTLNLSCGLGSFPGSSMVSLMYTDKGVRSDSKPDLISCGLISLEAAEEYFRIYQKYMEPCVCHVLAGDDCLANIRARSPFLTAAICTVGSYCVDTAAHQKCYDLFLKEVSSRLFSRQHGFDDVRALCIGAFWLNKVSSALSGQAVRMATDLNLHRCITKMPHSKIECYERTRLYYVVYICDHHCTLVYGKPPMTQDFRSLKSPKFLLQSKFSKPEDVKLISQVELWAISSRVFEVFGADIEAAITTERVAELDALSRAIDLCRSAVLASTSIGNDPSDLSQKLFELYIHCAKLSLFSHAFRGSSQRSEMSSNPSQGIEKFQRSALESALAIVQAVAGGNGIEGRLEALPSYIGTMVAFASVTLKKAIEKEPTTYYLEKEEVSAALGRLVEVFQAHAARLPTAHPLRSMARSLSIALKEYCQRGQDCSNVGFIPEALDETMFDFDNTGSNSLGLGYLNYNDYLSHPDDFRSGFLDLPTL